MVIQFLLHVSILHGHGYHGNVVLVVSSSKTSWSGQNKTTLFEIIEDKVSLILIKALQFQSKVFLVKLV